MLKLSHIFVILLLVLFKIEHVAQALPWTPNTREHLFGQVTKCPQADKTLCSNPHPLFHSEEEGYHGELSLQDEGFRWRNSFNFTIAPPHTTTWHFCKVKDLDHQNHFINSNAYAESSPNDIHIHLSKLAAKVQQLNQSASASACAISIVVEKDNQYHAFSKVVTVNVLDSSLPLVATTLGTNGTMESLIYATANTHTIKTHLSFLQSNIQETAYACSEGKILERLLFHQTVIKNNIKHLLETADISLNCK